jgi:hypothetical protein
MLQDSDQVAFQMPGLHIKEKSSSQTQGHNSLVLK